MSDCQHKLLYSNLLSGHILMSPRSQEYAAIVRYDTLICLSGMWTPEPVFLCILRKKSEVIMKFGGLSGLILCMI